MDLPEYVSDEDFSDDIEQIEDAMGPSPKFPLPRLVAVEPWRDGPKVTVEWSNRT